MKLIWLLSAVIAFNFIVDVHAGECDKFTGSGAKSVGPGFCCKVPEMKDAPLVKKIFEELKAKDFNFSASVVAECKIIEQLLIEKKILKDKEIDKEASLKYLETLVDDAKWKDVLKSGFEMCFKEVNEKITEIQDRLEKLPATEGGVKKDQCNIKVLAITACIGMESIFKKCPDEYMNKDKDCNSLREWVGKCRSNMNSLSEFGSRISM